MPRLLSALVSSLSVIPALTAPVCAAPPGDPAPVLTRIDLASDQSAEVDRCMERARARAERRSARGQPTGLSDAVVRCTVGVYDPDARSRKRR